MLRKSIIRVNNSNKLSYMSLSMHVLIRIDLYTPHSHLGYFIKVSHVPIITLNLIKSTLKYKNFLVIPLINI